MFNVEFRDGLDELEAQGVWAGSREIFFIYLESFIYQHEENVEA